MFCSQCGEEIRPGAKFCAYCGAKAPAPATRVPGSGAAKETLRSVMNTAKETARQTVSNIQTKAAQPRPQAPQQPQQTYPTYQNAAPFPGQTVVVSDQGMAWYKFIIWVQLWASAVVFVGAGITMLTGSHYRGGASLVYNFIPSLHTVDILFGLSLLAFAAYCVYTRFALAKFRHSGPTHYLWVYALSIILPVIYLICVYVILSNLGGSLSSLSFSDLMGNDNTIELVVYLIFDVIMIVVNKIYFDKRRHLFVN